MNRQLFKAALLTTFLFATTVEAQTLDSVLQSYVDDIEQAQSELSSVQNTISSDRQELSEQVNRAQNAVLDLREQAIEVQRAADDQTLSLSSIRDKVDEWDVQSVFQSRLLTSFLNRAIQIGDTTQLDGSMQNSIEGLRSYMQQLQGQTIPQWTAGQLILQSGEISTAELLTVGPVIWYTEGENGGLAELDDSGVPTILLPFENDSLANLQAIRASGSGNITLDPTLSQATQVALESESVLEHVGKGGIWIYPILSFALFATIVSIFKAISLARLPKLAPALAERMEQAVANGSTDSIQSSLKGTQAELVEITLRPQTAEQRDERLYACLLDLRNNLDKWLGAIALTAAVSPLLGLLGTVSGMIHTFQLMTIFGAGDASSVSSGISEALVTTELGLVVAIPALIAHALMSRKAKSYYANLETTAIRLSQLPLEASK